ncbi:hypothetical protein AB7008_37280 [Bradyrhizobium sp. 521_C7_N1_3]|uniref:hypothetical protein n=1 Tax=Bradyrhizobium TaxID=374 RepID=UPI001BAD0907|nr:hypothetical protein [Bradyrhizobium japonicum]MBR0916452.1 hypothetical protein [Bradyrhizobium japonicum]
MGAPQRPWPQPAPRHPLQSQPRLQRLRSIRLLDAGRRLDGLIEEFKAAAARLADATALARTRVPDVPEEIVCDSREWSDCWYDYCDVDGKDFPTETYVDDHGKTKWRPRLKFVDADRLRAFAKEIRCDGRTAFGKRVKRMIAAAEQYESDRAAAIERSGLPEAQEAAFLTSQAIDNLAREVAAIEPKTSAGPLYWRACSAPMSRLRDYTGNRHHGVMILGKPLAEAVARLA